LEESEDERYLRVSKYEPKYKLKFDPATKDKIYKLLQLISLVGDLKGKIDSDTWKIKEKNLMLERMRKIDQNTDIPVDYTDMSNINEVISMPKLELKDDEDHCVILPDSLKKRIMDLRKKRLAKLEAENLDNGIQNLQILDEFDPNYNEWETEVKNWLRKFFKRMKMRELRDGVDDLAALMTKAIEDRAFFYPGMAANREERQRNKVISEITPMRIDFSEPGVDEYFTLKEIACKIHKGLSKQTEMMDY
jgi:hypothetical protein